MQKWLQTLKLEKCKAEIIRYVYKVYFNDKNLNILFHATVHSMMMDHRGPQHVRFDVLNVIVILPNCVLLFVYTLAIE
jgi:hypothetical protein